MWFLVTRVTNSSLENVTNHVDSRTIAKDFQLVRFTGHRCSNSTADFRQFKSSSADEGTLRPSRDLLSPVNYSRESQTSPLECNLPGAVSLPRYRRGNEEHRLIHLEPSENISTPLFRASVPFDFRYLTKVKKPGDWGRTIILARFKSSRLETLFVPNRVLYCFNFYFFGVDCPIFWEIVNLLLKFQLEFHLCGYDKEKNVIQASPFSRRLDIICPECFVQSLLLWGNFGTFWDIVQFSEKLSTFC